ncbi:hypothetical protein B0H16DRAFT_1517792 [Mycena metata]|uniref:Uncharacterized protein n=1 Tax=Mycena metata TaxID=1033252 RepID=A0AAD7NPC5_9AGAR|nr:hypothetical protein B0H16DRAFT_1517792 [Mycena metata]
MPSESLDSKGRYPQDMIGALVPRLLLIGLTGGCTVAIFHALFYPTQGNIIDWSLKVKDGVWGRFWTKNLMGLTEKQT